MILSREEAGALLGAPAKLRDRAFLGSGTTLVAAELTERCCYGLELDPKYVDVIVERWQQLTGKQARLDEEVRQTFEAVKARRGGAAA